ncbi:MAG: quinone oxidoreductase [Burkholderia sp.]|jgi:NADPH2:quinone reductase|uniref:quinone oxidoreductase family protein n=1 Tax=Burkholderia sp. TaxID=36773 RepID=UPI00282E57DE|nr:quinone oxidoreductase [Burkholderia sp.]MDR0243337.1 quinone oxidoreductase [Burkholderia sp.]
MRSVVMTEPGGPQVLKVVDGPEPIPGPGDVLVEVAAAGVNFMDIGVRRGALGHVDVPKVLGVEGAGRVLAAGSDVRAFRPGDRVAWVYAPGSYAERIVIPADSLVPLPAEIGFVTATSVMMQGLTAMHFALFFHQTRPDEVAFVHAAAGGVGQLLTQLIKLKGGKVIGRVSSPSKVGAAINAGADHVIVDDGDGFAGEVLSLTHGQGVDVVYDGSGPATFEGSVEILRRGGTLCWYGPVLGGPGSFDITSLPKSIKIGYAVYSDSVNTPELLRARSQELFGYLSTGVLAAPPATEYALNDAAQAHEALESRATTGKLVLIP